MTDRLIDTLPPEAVVAALIDASKRLLLSVDVDREFHALLDLKLDPGVVIKQLGEYLVERRRTGSPSQVRP